MIVMRQLNIFIFLILLMISCNSSESKESVSKQETINKSVEDNSILSNNNSNNNTYTDSQEEYFDKDSENSSNIIYKGGWPYNPNKDQMIDVGFKDCNSIPYGNGCECTEDSQCLQESECEILFTSQNCLPKAGAQLPNFIGIDQFGDSVNLYDFANQDKLILIEVSTMWAKPGNAMAEWLAGNPETIETMRWWQDNFNQVKDLIDAGDIYYIRVLHQGSIKNDIITDNDILYWQDAYSHTNIINLADPQANLKTWVRPTGYPCFMLFNPDMSLHTPAEGVNGDAQRRRGLKAPFEATINYLQK